MKKKPTKKAKKLESLSQTHGKEEKDFEPTTLAQIWGDDGVSKYGTLNEGKYVEGLNDMHFSDVRTHAADLGLVPIDDRALLTKRLLSEFRRHVGEYTMPKENKEEPKKIDEEIQKILEEGK